MSTTTASYMACRLTFVCLFGLALSSQPAHAIDLAGAYRRALSEDPAYQAAAADTEARREAIPQARAQFLPSISGSLMRSKNQTDQRSLSATTPIDREYEYFSSNYAISLKQPIYRRYNFALYQQAKSDVASAEANLDRNLQDLAVRTANAYFDALMARYQLELILSQKKTAQIQVTASVLAFEKGHGTRTDPDDAKARLKVLEAQEIQARQNISYRHQQLESIINEPVTSLAELDPSQMKPTLPIPTDLKEWTSKAEEVNPELVALRASVESANQELEKARAGHHPTVDLFVQRSQSQSENNVSINNRYLTSQIGLQVNIPIFSGGGVSSQTRQARANITKLEQQYEARRRDVAVQVRKEFQGVVEGAARIDAISDAEKAAAQALESNKRSMQAGTRNLLDVFNAEQQLASTRRDLADARIQYILSRLRLQALTGSLNEVEIEAVNAWLIDKTPTAGVHLSKH